MQHENKTEENVNTHSSSGDGGGDVAPEQKESTNATPSESENGTPEGITTSSAHNISVEEPNIHVVPTVASTSSPTKAEKRPLSATNLSKIDSTASTTITEVAEQVEEVEASPVPSASWKLPKSTLINSKVVTDDLKLKKKVRLFYEQQNELIESFLEHEDSDDEEEDFRASERDEDRPLFDASADERDLELVTEMRKKRYNDSSDSDQDVVVTITDAAEPETSTAAAKGSEQKKRKGKGTGKEKSEVKLTKEERAAEKEVKEARFSKLVDIAVQLSFWCNILLFLLKVGTSIASQSLSVITSAVDSSLDLLSGLILVFTNRIRKKQSMYSYPVGKSRLEPLGFVVFATAMCTASLQIIKEAIVELIEYDPLNPPLIHQNEIFLWVSVGVLGFTAVLKLFLHLFCRPLSSNPVVEAYAEDHRNDVLSNTFLAISLVCSKWVWWLDAAASICLSLYIIQSWIRNSYAHIKTLVGKTAPPDFLKRLTFISYNHHPLIEKIDTVRAYFIGIRYYVEVDVVLPRDMPLDQAHDIGESLQIKLEALDDVERAFVHLDYEYDHKPEHKPIV